ncbi:hypothetical protein C1645_841966 [Glomus cerebriforme]|uniref:Uncharacterized protein n=1 Tax=Glomus cerebriforme TaxID=658196 RepID=A0A397RXN8_9GLOM|nr:hypothetical protein C1645_841966 [Glomus cerebriforme]
MSFKNYRAYYLEKEKVNAIQEIKENIIALERDCNLSNDYPEWLLKNLFFRGLSPEDIFKVHLDGLQALALLDDIINPSIPLYMFSDHGTDVVHLFYGNTSS